MRTLPLAGLLGLASFATHAQLAPPRLDESGIVTATRALVPATGATIRDTTVITRAQIEAAGPLTLAEVLQRYAGAEVVASGGPGQPASILMRGAGVAQTLVLVDGLRVGAATSGRAALESIPLEMVERIEVVKGPLSGLYGSDAIGGVVQVFTRGRSVPHLFGASALGTDSDRRASAGFATSDERTTASLSAGYRKVDARSASNPRAAFGHDPDRDPHESAFAVVRASHRMWTGEVLSLDAFMSDSKTSRDAGDPRARILHTLSGARIGSSMQFLPGWSMGLVIGHSRDKQRSEGASPGVLESRQDQVSWINDFRVPAGNVLLGAEALRQKVQPTTDASGLPRFERTQRDTGALFASLRESWQGQHLEANARRDRDPQYGSRNTGSVSYGAALTASINVTYTEGRAFRVPGFDELYRLDLPSFRPNPALLPERSRSRELALKSLDAAAVKWSLTAFDNRIDDLVTPLGDTLDNVGRARIRGLELSAEGQWLGVRLRGSLTAQRPRDEATGSPLPLRAQRHGVLDASRSFGPVTAGLTVAAAGVRHDAGSASADARLSGYARVDARLRYTATKFWSVELSGVNLTDRRYENALGYDAPRRGALLSLRFDAF